MVYSDFLAFSFFLFLDQKVGFIGVCKEAFMSVGAAICPEGQD